MKEINFRGAVLKNNTKLKIVNLRFSEKLKKGQVFVKIK